jgi:intein/homing endonuclease
MVSAGRSPLVFLLNSDVILHKDSIDKLIRVMDDPKVGVVGMKLIFPDDVEGASIGARAFGKLQHIGLTTNIRAEVLHAFIGWSPDHPRVNAQKEVFAVTGAAMMTRRLIWRRIGGFFEGYGMGCLVGDTYVFTENGLQQMKDIVSSDEINLKKILIATKDGVENTKLTVNNGIQPTIQLKLEKRFSICGTPNHKIIVMNKNGKYDWKEISEVDLDDYVAIRAGANLWGNDYIDIDFAYLMGLYTAEGSFENRGRGRITITSKDELIHLCLKKNGFKQQKDKIHWRKTGKIIDKMKSYGMDFSQKAKTKTIPIGILQAGKDSVVGYLQGLFDGDGCAKNNGTVTLSSSSLELIKQVQMLLLNIGIVSGIYIKREKNISYSLELGSDSKLFYDYIGFRLSRKQTRNNLLPVTLSDSIPHQRKRFASLHNKLGWGEKQWTVFGPHNINPSQGVRRDTIRKLLCITDEFKYLEEFKYLNDLIQSDWVWLKVKEIKDKGQQRTYDLHVPGSHSYIANGIVAHNTYEEVDFQMAVREIGYNILVEPEASGIHYTGATAEKYDLGNTNKANCSGPM